MREHPITSLFASSPPESPAAAPWTSRPASMIKLELEELLQQGIVCSEAWETAVEKLAVGLTRDRVCVLSVPAPHAAAYARCLQTLGRELQARPPAGTAEAPGSRSLHFRAGGPGSALLDMAYCSLEGTARAALTALCRSRLLRLRGDTFTPILDDLPMPRTQQGSSLLTVQVALDNFQASSQGQGAPVFEDPQEEASGCGLLTLIIAQEAQDPQRGQLSALQVKDAAGKWRDVELRQGEVAVVLGRTLQHVTAGVVSPTTHRVAGDPYARGAQKGQSRRLLAFELRPHPAAVLDFHRHLAAAGHEVASKYASPASVRSLMEQFEGLMSPAGRGARTPDAQEGGLGAWAQTTAAKCSRKRSLDVAELGWGDEAEGAAPVTRSGNVRRTSSGGLVNEHGPSRFKQQAAAAAAAAAAAEGAAGVGGGGGAEGQRDMSEDRAEPTGRSSGSDGALAGARRDSLSSGATASRGAPSGGGGRHSGGKSARGVAEALRCEGPLLELGGSASRLYHVRGRTCTVLGGSLQDEPGDCMTLCVRSFTGIECWFYLNRALPCGRIFESWTDRMGVSLGAVKFLYKGSRVFGADSPAALKVGDGEEFVAVPESSDRLQQAQELGPLFGTLFATAPPKDLPV